MHRDLIYIINVGNDPGFAAIANDASFPALGVLALGTWLKRTLPELEVVVRDGQVTPMETLVGEIQRRKPGLVALSVLATSYRNALLLAEVAKDCGAYTVMGNDQAAQLSREILRRRPYVDFVIGSEYGERTLELLTRSLRTGTPRIEDIPELTYRRGREVCGFDYDSDRSQLSIVSSPLYRAPSRQGALDVFPLVNRRLYPEDHWRSYLANYMAKFAHLHHGELNTGVTTMNRARGCSRANTNIKCKFCDMLLDVSLSSPEMFWHEVELAHAQVGATIFYEVCDSLTSFPSFIDSLVRARPDSLPCEPKFFVYGQARDLVRRPALVKQLAELGVFRVNIGLEAGSDATLKHLKGKYDSVEINYAALQLLREYNIYAYGSFVLGSPAETPKTLAETVRWAEMIIREDLVVDVSAQPVVPLPHNVYGKMLVRAGLIHDHTDLPWSVDQLGRVFIDRYSGVSYEDTLAAAREIRSCAGTHGVAAGSGISSQVHYATE